MAYPTVIGVGTWDSAGADVATIMATIPGGAQAGDVLVVFQTRSNVNNGGTPDSFWTAGNIVGVPGQANCRWLYHVCTGGESGTVAVTTIGISDPAGTICLLLRGVTGAPEGGAGVAATATVNADPPSLTPSWGAQDTLWLIYGMTSTGTRTATLPGSYGSATTQNAGIGSSSAVVARREANVATEDPAAIVWSASGDTGALSVAVRGAAAAPVTRSQVVMA